MRNYNDVRTTLPLTKAEKKALEEARRNPLTLSTESVLGRAQEITGLSDFGRSDYRDRLHSWLGMVDSDKNRTEFDRARTFDRCARSACKRLRLNELLRCHPEIHETTITRPIIIAGPGRTGTSHLHGLIASDARLNSITWKEAESLFSTDSNVPEIADGTKFEDISKEISSSGDNRYRSWLRAVLPRTIDDVAEDMVMMEPDFPIGMLGFREFLSPEDFLKYDHVVHYEYLRSVLQALQWQKGDGQWVLKDPVHSLELPSILKVFPDAVVVLTYRDPVAIVQSIAELMLLTCRLRYKKFDHKYVFDASVERAYSTLSAIIRDREFVASGNRVDVLYHDFVNDKINTLTRIYDAAGIEMERTSIDTISNYISFRKRSKGERIDYDIRSEFGVDPKQIRDRFAWYVEKVPVQIEVE